MKLVGSLTLQNWEIARGTYLVALRAADLVWMSEMNRCSSSSCFHEAPTLPREI